MDRKGRASKCEKIMDGKRAQLLYYIRKKALKRKDHGQEGSGPCTQ
jgi:hypothetical protein